MKHTPLKRYKQLRAKKRDSLKRRIRMRQRRAKPRRGQLTAAEVKAVRLTVYERDGHRCTIRASERCLTGDLPFTGSIYERFHACHIQSEGAGGKFVPENLRGGCYFCHIETEHLWGKTMQKPCPPKPERVYEVGA